MRSILRTASLAGLLAALVLGLAGCDSNGGSQANAPEAEPARQMGTPIAGPAPSRTPGVPEPDPSPTKQPAIPRRASLPVGSGFDFYVLSLSWSPSYCEAEGADANRQQCASGRPYAFVVHGLWPQFERGYPQDCPTGEPDVPRDRLSGLYDLMPSAGLIRHEWRKHGSCSGLSQRDYFAVLRAARERVAVPVEFRRLDAYRTLDPDDAEAAFLRANASLPAAGIAITCDKRFLREVRICLTKYLDFRACQEIDRRECRAAKIVMPPVRGG